MRQALGFYALTICIALFLVLNVENISERNQHYLQENLDATKGVAYTDITAFNDNLYASALDGLEITLHPGTSFNKDSKSDNRSLTHCKALVYQTLVSLPEDHRGHLKHLTLYFAEGRRGLAGGSQMILRCSDINDMELASVIVHEMGHVVDTGLNTGNYWAGESEFMDGHLNIYKDDLSLKFYRISWKDESTMKDDAHMTDFVTRYAMTDPFEDFAETYNYYVLHGEQFREMAEYNRLLQQKYLFMKYFVFLGKEFDNDPYTETDYFVRTYDSTLLMYDKAKFTGETAQEDEPRQLVGFKRF